MGIFITSLFNLYCLFRLTGWVLLKLFNSFFWNIQIHKGQLEMVKAATEVKTRVCVCVCVNSKTTAVIKPDEDLQPSMSLCPDPINK